MKIFLKGLIIGIGKVIPGVSGALLAINFNVYERGISAISNFLTDWKNNLRFILLLGSGILLSIIFGSKIIFYLLSKYHFIIMFFFTGLIIGGTYKFSKKINYKLYLIFIIILLFLFFNNVIISNLRLDNKIFKFFLGGCIEAFTMIIPGISGTALFMNLNIYNDILLLIGNILNYNYIINNLDIYISYGVGLFLSFIITIYMINYLYLKHSNFLNLIILSLSIISIISLLFITFNDTFNFVMFIIGLMLFFIGIIISYFLS